MILSLFVATIGPKQKNVLAENLFFLFGDFTDVHDRSAGTVGPPPQLYLVPPASPATDPRTTYNDGTTGLLDIHHDEPPTQLSLGPPTYSATGSRTIHSDG